MPEYRYQRMTDNAFGWKRPHTGRLGIAGGYVSEQGFGHEDWNFARDVWEDGRYHLYLTAKPKKADLGEIFNIVLGAHTKTGAMILGFADNVRYSISNLPDAVWERRAQEIKALEEAEQLGPRYRGKTIKQIANGLIEEVQIYNASVAPENLHILDQPVLIPKEIFEVTTPQYRLLPMSSEQYLLLKEITTTEDFMAAVDLDDDISFPEGAQIEKLHRSRERNRRLVALAKEAFIKKNGSLYCEACDMEPTEYFKDRKLAGKIIEAHHNIGVADPAHTGRTKIQDLRMLCPSCHRAIHTIRPWLSVMELRDRLGTS